jgi:hypothetical protein
MAYDQDEREDGNDDSRMKEGADALVPPETIWQEREREHRG